MHIAESIEQKQPQIAITFWNNNNRIVQVTTSSPNNIFWWFRNDFEFFDVCLFTRLFWIGWCIDHPYERNTKFILWEPDSWRFFDVFMREFVLLVENVLMATIQFQNKNENQIVMQKLQSNQVWVINEVSLDSSFEYLFQ